MPINHEHQMTILKDILENHQMDCCGTVSECEQIERLAKSLMGNESIKEHTRNILSDIYSYGQNGKYCTNLNEHITSHQQMLSQWIKQLT